MLIIGHRGVKGLAPENTLASLQKALEHHVDEIEFDVRVTKDKVPILHHDAELIDPDGKRHVIAESSYKELLARKSDLATFKEALVFASKVSLYIEVKPNELVKPIVATIKKYLASGGRAQNLRLGSFSQQTLLELHATLPEIEKIVIEKWSGVQATRRARRIGAKRISMDQRWIWFGFVRAMARSGYQLGLYTLNDPRKAQRWQKWGLAAVITDYPDLYKS